MKISQNNYSTFDFQLAVVLTAFSQSPKLSSQWKNWRIRFAFGQNSRLKELVEKYYSKQLNIEPILLFSNFKLIKQRLYQYKEAQSNNYGIK